VPTIQAPHGHPKYYEQAIMTRVVIAEYHAQENALRLVEPLVGIKDHERIRVSIDEPRTNGDRPWLALRGVLSSEAGDSLAAAIDEMFGSAE
jgi:hypothetical protein